MPNALNTGVSGLIAHQRMLDVVGNNLANVNTPGFKVQRTLFADLLYEIVRPASSDSTGDAGGVNPNQVGSGVKVSQISRKFGQGNLELTGGLFDFAIQGDGMFVVSDGNKQYYTRTGAFALDSDFTLVDPSTGFRVQRFGTLGEPSGAKPGFQTPGDPKIVVPFGTIIPGLATNAMQMQGNLNSESKKQVAAVLTTNAPFTTDGTTPATSATLLNDLYGNNVPYTAGDIIRISGEDFDGTKVNVDVAASASTTLGELLTAIDNAFTMATAELDAEGNIVVTADQPGESGLQLAVFDAGTTKTDFTPQRFLTTTEGQNAGTYTVTSEIYDIRGVAHEVTVTFTTEVESNTWAMTTTMSSDEGQILQGSNKTVEFNEDGSFRRVIGENGVGDGTLTFLFVDTITPQTIDIDFGSGSDSLLQFATRSTALVRPDGSPPGALSSVSMTLDGVLNGVATNGRTVPIAQLSMASFANPQGLTATGDNYYLQSLNSGEPSIGQALSGGRGTITGGNLETSNVDIAHEFTRLIVAQRGFSANARTITVADEMLEELTNTVR